MREIIFFGIAVTVISGLEEGAFKLTIVDGKEFFGQILTDTRNGFLADPI